MATVTNGLPLSLVAAAIERVERAAALSPSVMVGVSGGKDSLVTLDIVMRAKAYRRVELFAMYLVPGLRLFEEPIKRVAAKYGLPVHFVPHFDVARLLKAGILRFHVIGAQKLYWSKQRDVEAALRAQTGIDWFAYGERASDSMRRAIDTRRCDGVEQNWHRLWPIWDWKNAHIFSYLKTRRIPIPRTFAPTVQGDGLSLEPEVLLAIKKRAPDDYSKILKIFPFAELQIERYRRGDFKPVPKVRRRKASQEQAAGSALQPAEDNGGSAEEAES